MNYLFKKKNIFVDIPLRLILTKVDQLDLCIPGDLSGIFKSKQMADKVRLAKDKFGLQESQILPIASYVNETRQNIIKDVLALQAVENILKTKPWNTSKIKYRD